MPDFYLFSLSHSSSGWSAIVSPEARAIGERVGLDYVEDECTTIVHRAITL